MLLPCCCTQQPRTLSMPDKIWIWIIVEAVERSSPRFKTSQYYLEPTRSEKYHRWGNMVNVVGTTILHVKDTPNCCLSHWAMSTCALPSLPQWLWCWIGGAAYMEHHDPCNIYHSTPLCSERSIFWCFQTFLQLGFMDLPARNEGETLRIWQGLKQLGDHTGKSFSMPVSVTPELWVIFSQHCLSGQCLFMGWACSLQTFAQWWAQVCLLPSSLTLENQDIKWWL